MFNAEFVTLHSEDGATAVTVALSKVERIYWQQSGGQVTECTIHTTGRNRFDLDRAQAQGLRQFMQDHLVWYVGGESESGDSSPAATSTPKGR